VDVVPFFREARGNLVHAHAATPTDRRMSRMIVNDM
jgi:hypothetical protein